MKTELKKELSPVEWLESNLIHTPEDELHFKHNQECWQQAKEMEEDHKGYTESDMRSYASYILNNPVIEPSQWRKIYSNK